ncbi:MAG: pyridoxal phosphate-dependent aminotransferase [Synergistaceae bacterium]|nr:pyridoxal phosphate-dependent aminotransferase [Synergistaceae bacterium]
MKFSDRILQIKPSATLSISGKAKQMKAEGRPVISFSVGEPDFATPQAGVLAGIEAIKRGESHYTLTSGIVELRKEICNYYKNRFGLDYVPEEVTVCTGAKPLLYEAMQVLVNPGDEVILFVPAWVSYVEQLHLAGGKEILVDTMKTDFVPDIDALEAAITDKTVGIIFNSPNNPTGAMLDEKTQRQIAEAAKKHDLWIIADEIYERLSYGKNHVNILQAAPDIKDRTLIINGASKAYAMTGWRVGWALGPKEIVSKINSLQGHLTSNACSAAQWAALGALQGAEEDVEKMRLAFAERRETILKLIRDMPYLKITEPDGAFYAFVDIKDCPVPDDMEFCARLLEEKYVAAVPGTAFFAPGYIRISYASSMENIVEGMKRLKDFLESL